ncbi:hypothetical protein ACVOMT_16670 [Sphingomonas panni]
MHIDTTMRRPVGLSPAAGDAVTLMLAIHASFSRREVERAIDTIIAALDADDGDPDDEAGYAEDDYRPAAWTFGTAGPGCIVSDSDHCEAHDDEPGRWLGDLWPGDPDDAEEDDSAGDRAWVEWHDRDHNLTPLPHEPCIEPAMEEDDKPDCPRPSLHPR